MIDRKKTVERIDYFDKILLGKGFVYKKALIRTFHNNFLPAK